MNRTAQWILWILWTCAVAGCMELQQRAHERAVPMLNASGGYVEACGDLPGMLGDDC